MQAVLQTALCTCTIHAWTPCTVKLSAVRIWHALQDEAKAKAAGYDQDSGITVRVADVTKPAEYVPTCCKISAHAMQIRATTRAIHPDMFISAE